METNGGGVGWGEVLNGGFGMFLDGSNLCNKRIKNMIFFDVNNGIAIRSWAKNANALLAINKEMATKTMYAMMLKQKKYKIAHEILLTMKANKKHQKYVNIELKKIKKNLDKVKK